MTKFVLIILLTGNFQSGPAIHIFDSEAECEKVREVVAQAYKAESTEPAWYNGTFAMCEPYTVK